MYFWRFRGLSFAIELSSGWIKVKRKLRDLIKNADLYQVANFLK